MTTHRSGARPNSSDALGRGNGLRRTRFDRSNFKARRCSRLSFVLRLKRLGRFLNVVDDEDLYRDLCRFQFQPGSFLKGGEDRTDGAVGFGIVVESDTVQLRKVVPDGMTGRCVD